MCDFIQVVPGELSIVTGVPNSGKSEWIDALICNLAMRHGWSFALCSMEKKVCILPRLSLFIGLCASEVLLRVGIMCPVVPNIHMSL